MHREDGGAREGSQACGWYGVEIHTRKIERPHGIEPFERLEHPNRIDSLRSTAKLLQHGETRVWRDGQQVLQPRPLSGGDGAVQHPPQAVGDPLADLRDQAC